MAEPTQPSSAIPVAPIIQRQRAEIRVELDIAGASMTAISQVDELVDSIIAETLVIVAAELLRCDAPSVGQSLTRAEHLLLPNSYRTTEELLSRVSGDMATRSAAEVGYQRLRDLLSNAPRLPASTPPPLKPAVLPLTAPAIRAAFPPDTEEDTPRGEDLLVRRILYHLASITDYHGDPFVHTTPTFRAAAASNNPRASNDAAIGGHCERHHHSVPDRLRSV